MKRNTQQRRRAIIDLLSEQGEISVEYFASHFDTSEVTVRKDLAILESNGLVLRKHGGAILMPQERLEVNGKVSKRKMAIARLAATLLKDHDRIVIDSGTTTAAMLPEIKQLRGLLVMSNSLAVANELLDLENEPTLLLTGGTWDKQSQSFQGQMAEQMLRSYNFDLAFVGAAGIDIHRGTTTFNELTQLTRVMAETSRKVVVLAESEKFQRKMPNLELSWQCVSTLVTDSGIATEYKEQLESSGIEVLVAQA
ncbi:MAG: DeoR/GlpR family DNA-binding transcription regulator [Aestuariibacter sp.]